MQYGNHKWLQICFLASTILLHLIINNLPITSGDFNKNLPDIGSTVNAGCNWT